MSKINEHLGLRPPGKRSMMKLPTDRADRARLTSARCPQCQNTGAILLRSGAFMCSWCATTWNEPEAQS